jgi:arsenate reductase
MNHITIYHNPDCGTSRNVLALLRAAGAEPTVIEYLQTPPDRETLARMIAAAGLSVREAIRVKGTPYKELGLDDPVLTDEQLIEHMLRHPILINRPLVVADAGTRLCRPSDLVLDLLDESIRIDFDKEEGTPFLRDTVVRGDDPGLVAALMAAQLPIDDLAEPGRVFYAYRTLAGRPAGYGGFERYGQDALLRSIVVPAADQGKGVGRNLLALLQRRAFDQGARRAWLLTQTAAAFFERTGFKPAERATAPAAILATRQAADLCSASATLLSRVITW